MAWEKMKLPECGTFIGSGIYITLKHGFHLDTGVFSTWTPQSYSQLDYLDMIERDHQGNLAQVWDFMCSAPQTMHRFMALEDLGVPYPEPDWENRKNLTQEDGPDYSQYKDRLGAGLIKFIEKAKSKGIYTTGLYWSEIAPEWSAKLKGFGEFYLGYDFGERHSFHLCRGSNDVEKTVEDTTLEDFADTLIKSVSEHVNNCRAKGWGRIMATSGAFHLDYEILGGTDIPVQEDFAFRHLTISSAFSRGLYRQFHLPIWGSHLAHEHNSWIPYASKYKFPLLNAAMHLKYMHGCKLIIHESGNWFTQVKLCTDSPLHDLPYCTIGKNGDPTAPKDNHPYNYSHLVKEAEKHYPKIDYRSPTAVRYRQLISDFYGFIEENGTPAGQPEASFAIAKGNLDLCTASGYYRNHAVASAFHLADINPNWFEGDPELSWDLIKKVFCPCPPVIPPYKNQFLSATPLGVFDIVTFARNKISAEFLNANYKALIFAGWNTSSPEQYAILKAYVENGGILCISIPHLSTNKKRNYVNFGVEELVNGGDFSDLCGVKVKGRGRRIYWATGTSGDPNELGVKIPRRFGILSVPIGDIEITDPTAKVLLADDERFEPVVIRRRCGKGTVFFVNTWAYPGALDIDEGPGATDDSLGMMEPVYRHIAKLARGNVWITDDGQEPGKNCQYVSCTYFPDAGNIYLYNIDFDHAHKIFIHQFGVMDEIELNAGEFRTIASVKLNPGEKLNEE